MMTTSWIKLHLASFTNWNNVILATSVDANLEEFLSHEYNNMINDFFPAKMLDFTTMTNFYDS